MSGSVNLKDVCYYCPRSVVSSGTLQVGVKAVGSEFTLANQRELNLVFSVSSYILVLRLEIIRKLEEP